MRIFTWAIEPVTISFFFATGVVVKTHIGKLPIGMQKTQEKAINLDQRIGAQ